MRDPSTLFGDFDDTATTIPAGRLHLRGSLQDGQRDQPLPPALPGARLHIDTGAGRLAYYAGGRWHGRPLLLVHSVNAAASAAEMRPLFEHYAARRPVYALELPGFGASERLARAYTPRLMTDAVLAMQAEIMRLHGAVAVDAMALSLGCEFLARAATERPAAFRSLALISPTGFSGGRPLDGLPAASRVLPGLQRWLKGPRLGPALFRLLTRPGVIRYFLQRTFGSRQIDETLYAYCVATAQMPGAEHAPLAFLAREPFSADINTVYDAVQQPVWLAHGTHGSFSDVQRAHRMVEAAGWRLSAFDSGAMPHFQQISDFVRRYEQFIDSRVAPRRVQGE